MKWIGQHIYDLTSRFRSDVYLEDISTGTIAGGAHLGLDSNNKIVKAVDGGGDITSVVAGTNLSGGATSGAATVNLADASTSVKGAASFSSDNFAASSGAITIKNGGVDLTAEVTGVLPSANMDGDTAHLSGIQTFTGSKVFNEISYAVFDRDKTVTNLTDGAVIHVDAQTITNGSTSASGTATVFRHISIENPLLAATNLSVTTTDAATLYIKGPPVASTNQAITNPWALWVDSGNARFDGDIDLEGDIDVNGTLETDALTIGGAAVLAQATEGAVGAVELATTGEADTGTDTGRAVTPAGLKSHVDGRYTYVYMHSHGRSQGNNINWNFQDNSPDGNYNWEDNSGASAWDGSSSGVTNDGTNTTAGTSTLDIARDVGAMGIVVPHDCTLVGFKCVGRDLTGNDVFKAGLWSATPEIGNASTTEFTLRAVATASYAGGSGTNFNGICALDDLTANHSLDAGDVLLPSMSEVDTSRHYISMTIVLKVPII